MGQCAPEDSISQCPFLQMIDTAGNPHADGNAAPGARPRHRPSRHRDPPATSRSHDNWMAARQTSCRQQTAPPQPRCSKDVTTHPHRPGARPGRPCPVPARSGQPLSGRSRFSPAFGTEFFSFQPQPQHARPSSARAVPRATGNLQIFLVTLYAWLVRVSPRKREGSLRRPRSLLSPLQLSTPPLFWRQVWPLVWYTLLSIVCILTTLTVSLLGVIRSNTI